MIIDCHYHLDPRVQPLENLLLKMELNGIEKTAIMPTMCDPIPHNPEFLMKLMRFLLLNPSLHGLVKKLAAKFSPEGNLILPSGSLTIYKDPDNAPIAETLAKHPNKFMGWVFVNPRGQNDPVAEYEKWKNTEGFIGIKAHPFWHQYPPKELLPIAEKAAAADWPLLIHAGFDENGAFIHLVEQLPKLKLVLAHTGFPGYARTWKIIKKHPNIFVDLSADAYVNAKTAKNAVEALGVDRCLFGTDGPYGASSDDNLFDNGTIKRRIETIFSDETSRRKLLGENFRSLIS